jgi:hypothetical protein
VLPHNDSSSPPYYELLALCSLYVTMWFPLFWTSSLTGCCDHSIPVSATTASQYNTASCVMQWLQVNQDIVSKIAGVRLAREPGTFVLPYISCRAHQTSDLICIHYRFFFSWKYKGRSMNLITCSGVVLTLTLFLRSVLFAFY